MSDSKENSQDKKESGEENKGPTGVEANANTLTEINNEGGDDNSGDVPPINTNTDIVINLEEKDNNQPPAATRALQEDVIIATQVIAEGMKGSTNGSGAAPTGTTRDTGAPKTKGSL